jgi:DNA primase
MPLTWDEAKPGPTMKHFTIHNSIGRLKETGDCLKAYWATESTWRKRPKTHKTYLNKYIATNTLIISSLNKETSMILDNKR